MASRIERIARRFALLARKRVVNGMFEGFDERHIATRDSSIFARIGGSGPPLLLLHGFPETHLMWHGVAPLLAAEFTVVCADLPGQGASGFPASDCYSKRAMAAELTGAMRQLGHERFAAAGHDRGGRVAYRMALDKPATVTRVAVLDVIPIADAWRHADARLAQSFWPWSLLSQPAPLPERLISAAPEAVVDDATSQWGSVPDCFPAEVRRAYTEALRDPRRAHAVCEEFRSAGTIDRDHDEADRRSGHKIECPLLLLWDGQGALDRWYLEQGGPLGIWLEWASDVRGEPMRGGHFFPEAHPEESANRLRSFFLGET